MGDAIIFFGVLVIPCILFTVIGFVYNKYKDIEINKKLSGFEVAREILDKHKLDNVYIVEVKGNLNDHYDYNHKVLRLSSDVFHGETLTAAIVAARIASYAIQDKENNAYMRFRSTINPLATFVNYIAYILFIVAICMKDSSMFELANILIMLVFIFHVATLPVEFDACKRAMKYLEEKGYSITYLSVDKQGRIMLPKSEDRNFPSGLVNIHNNEIERLDERYGIKPDAEGNFDNGKRLLIEFYVSHKVDSKKRQIIVENNLKCIEIEIDIKYKALNKDELKKFLTNSDKGRKWIVVTPQMSESKGASNGSKRDPMYETTRDIIKNIFDKGTIIIHPHHSVSYDLRQFGYDVWQ